MAKKEDIQEAGKSVAGGQGPETPADQIAHNIETVDDLEACYPQLVSEIRDEVIDRVTAKLETLTAKQIKKDMPELYERIVMEIQSKSGPNLNVPGFLLEVDDPVARGTLRAYQRLKGLADLQMPFVLPFKDKATKAALENYILRAEGSGNYKRAKAARKAMEKIK